MFGSCIIHILYTGCAKVKKNNPGAKRLVIHYKMYLLYSQMKHKQIYHIFDEVHTLYFQDKHSTLIHKQHLNTVILH